MPRTLSLLALGLLTAAPAVAQPPTPAGRWKLQIALDNQPATLLFGLTESGGKWVGDFLGSQPELRTEPKFTSVTVSDAGVKFTLGFPGREFVNFDGVLSKDGKKLTGSVVQLGGPLAVAEAVRTELKKADPFDLLREAVAAVEPGPALFDAGFAVLEQAAARKLSAEDVRGLTDRLAKAAGGFGPRWERATALRLANVLAVQAGYGEVAVAQARRAERMLTDDDPAAAQMEVFDALAKAFTRAGKAEEGKKYAAQVAKLEAKDYAEYAKATYGFAGLPVPTPASKGRPAVVEVFTGSEAGPAAASDLAAAALRQVYTPADVIVLSYHLHAGGADPLASPDGMERLEYYAETLRLQPSVPLVFVNGGPGPRGGGPASAAKAKLDEYKTALAKPLGLAPGAKLTLTVTKGDKGYTAKATVADVTAAGDKLSLRFVLAEDRVRYAGGSGMRYHAAVVRAMPGGAKGFPLAKKAGDQTVTFDPAEVRTKLTQYLDDVAKQAEFARSDRPMGLTSLKLVALVQNDATGEIVQAVQVDVK
ncbi:MAG: hypothetical protein U0871_14495 [Gemmataceae bacterium]